MRIADPRYRFFMLIATACAVSNEAHLRLFPAMPTQPIAIQAEPAGTGVLSIWCSRAALLALVATQLSQALGASIIVAIGLIVDVKSPGLF